MNLFFFPEMKLCAFSREQFTTIRMWSRKNKIGVKSEMSSTQQYSLNFMNIPLNDDNNGECTIGKMYLHHLQNVKEIN